MDSDNIVPFLIGSLLTTLVALAVIVGAIETTKADTLESACGACEPKGKLCGEYVCTQHGWE